MILVDVNLLLYATNPGVHWRNPLAPSPVPPTL
jgi:hypothetical protein